MKEKRLRTRNTLQARHIIKVDIVLRAARKSCHCMRKAAARYYSVERWTFENISPTRLENLELTYDTERCLRA